MCSIKNKPTPPHSAPKCCLGLGVNKSFYGTEKKSSGNSICPSTCFAAPNIYDFYLQPENSCSGRCCYFSPLPFVHFYQDFLPRFCKVIISEETSLITCWCGENLTPALVMTAGKRESVSPSLGSHPRRPRSPRSAWRRRRTT